MRDGAPQPLTPTEVKLLDYLLAHAGEELSFRRLLQEVWGYSDKVESRTVYTTVGRLRQKIERDPSDPRHLLAVPGVGYRFEGPGAPREAGARPGGLYGREADLAALREALAEAPIVALVGPGGVGKTTLAAAFDPEAPLVALGAARDGSDVVAAVAGALGLGGSPGAERVGRALAARDASLLILDEVEGIADALGVLDTWRELAPEARFLLTSRVPPPLEGLRLLPLLPLALPEGAAEGPAVGLFLARAGEGRTGGALDRGRSDEIVALVRRLDGIPLALELAATRMSVLSPGELLARMDAGARPLRRRGEEGRHASLEAVLASTVALLDVHEQRALAQASVFVGGFGLDAAEAVLDLGPEAPPVLDVLEDLVARALLRVAETGPTRFLLLETVRAFAAERLEAPERTRRRHAAWASGFGADAWTLSLRRTGGAARVGRTRRERENVLAAAKFALEVGDGALAGAAVMAASTVLSLTGPLALAVDLLERALGLALDDETQARLLSASAIQHDNAGRPEQALSRAREAERLSADPRLLGVCATARGGALASLGRYEEAAIAGAEAVQFHRRAHAEDLARALVYHGNQLQWLPGRLEEARAQLEEAVRVARAVGYPSAESGARGHLAQVALAQGRVDEAWTHARAAVELVRGEDRNLDLLFALSNLASTALAFAPEQARAPTLEARALALQTGDLRRVAWTWHYEQLATLDAGDRPGSLLAADRAIQVLGQVQMPALEAQVRLFVALILLIEGKVAAGLVEAGRARELARRAPPSLVAMVEAACAWAALRSAPALEAVRALEVLRALRVEEVMEQGLILAIQGHASLDVGGRAAARAALETLRADPHGLIRRAELRFLAEALAQRLGEPG